MKRVAWITDVHLNFLSPPGIEKFFQAVAGKHPDAVLLTGDMGEAHDVGRHLAALHGISGCPVFFVLGNHDFYQGSIANVRSMIETLCSAVPNLVWMPRAGVVPLTERTGLVGHDGWGDGRLGDYWGSPIELNDWRRIGDFVGLDRVKRLAKLHALGDEAAAHFRAVLPEALSRFGHVIVLTHVPPFREACWHEGRISDEEWLPHFTCKAVGAALVEAMAICPDRTMTVLTGHTHGAGEAWILPNLKVLTGGAVYGSPGVQRMLEVE